MINCKNLESPKLMQRQPSLRKIKGVESLKRETILSAKTSTEITKRTSIIQNHSELIHHSFLYGKNQVKNKRKPTLM